MRVPPTRFGFRLEISFNPGDEVGIRDDLMHPRVRTSKPCMVVTFDGVRIKVVFKELLGNHASPSVRILFPSCEKP